MQIILATVLITIAYILYTLSLVIGWKRICFGSTLSLGIAIFPDMFAAKIMFDISESFNWTLHTTIGLFALIAMIILAIMGIFLWCEKKDPVWFRIVYRVAYAAWTISFIAGIIEHMI